MKTEKHIIKGHFKGKRPHVKVTAYELSAVDCSADKMSGYYSQEATLISDDPEPGYDFAGWSVTGSNVTGNNVRFEGDITAKANYSAHVYNVTLQNDGHGTIAANKNTGNLGDTITLSNTPATHYHFSGYSITGANLTSNQFNIETNDVTAKGWFSEDPKYNLTLQNDGHGSIGAGKTTGYQGDTTTLSNTANNGYVFSAYTVTGATLNGSTLTFGAQNATAKALFRADSAVLVNKGSTEYKFTGSKTGQTSWDLGLPASTNYKYLTYNFNMWRNSASKYQSSDSDGFFYRASNSSGMGAISGYYSTFITVGWCNFTNFTSAAGANVYRGGSGPYYWNTTAVVKPNTWLHFKTVFDRNNKRGYVFVDNNYFGYFTMNKDPFDIKKFSIYHNNTKTGAWMAVKNLSIAGFNNFNAASSYNG